MRRLLPCLLLAGLAIGQTPCVGATAAPLPSGNRYLFIMETSTAMRQLEHGGRQALFDMIHTGLRGHMRAGDTYGVWTFNKDLRAGVFPMQTWSAEAALNQATQASLFVKDQKHAKQTRLDPVVSGLSAVIRSAKDVYVFLLTTGAGEIKGTPFDLDINTAYQLKATQVSDQKRPLVTTLIARDGQIADWSVTLAGDSIGLPARPAPTPTAKASPPPAPEAKPAPARQANPIIMTGAAAAPAAQQSQANTTSATPEPNSKISNAPQSPTPVTVSTGTPTGQAEPTATAETDPATSSLKAAPPSATTASGATVEPPPSTRASATAPAPSPGAEARDTATASAGPETSTARSAAPPTAAPPPKPTTSASETPPASKPGPPPGLASSLAAIPAPANPPGKPQGAATASRPAAKPGPPVTEKRRPGGLLGPVVMLATGIGLAAVGLGLIVLFLRRYRIAAQMTYISRSMEQR